MEIDFPILFFDGVCHLCNTSVKWILRLDRYKVLKFSPLQSELAAELLGHNAEQTEFKSMIFYFRGEKFYQADAFLQIVNYLGFPYNLLKAIQIFPKAWLNELYNLVAANRYHVFGKDDSCPMPSDAYKSRFLK